MTLILNGTDNSATTPAVTGTDTDTGVYYPAANQVALATNGTLALIVNASQQVGIGTASPDRTFSVAGVVRFDSTGNIFGKADNTGTLNIYGGGDYTTGAGVIVTGNTSGSYPNTIQFYRNSFTYSGMIDANGILLLGKLSATANGGDIQVSAGISFPSAQVTKSDPNTLDDYEEGTWTPTINGTTMPSGSGWYTKIGRQVFCGFNNLTGVAALADNAQTAITGNPFPITSYTQGGAISINFNDESDSYKGRTLVGRTTNISMEVCNRSGVATTTSDPFNMVASYQIL